MFTGRFTPEASLVRMGHLAFDPASGGPVVDQYGRCSDPSYFAAGNLLRPVETAGWSWREGREVGAAVATDLTDGLPQAERTLTITPVAPVRYALPQTISLPIGRPALPALQLRVARAVSGTLRLRLGSHTVWQRRVSARPEQRLTVPARSRCASLGERQPGDRIFGGTPRGRLSIAAGGGTAAPNRRGREIVMRRKITRRSVLKGMGTAAAASALPLPYIRNAEAATLKLRWLGWEHYNVKSLVAEFEKDNNVNARAAFFDGNSEAYNKLKAGGTERLRPGAWPTASGRASTTRRA